MNCQWKPRGHNCGWGVAPADARLLLWALLDTNENSQTLQRPWGQNSFLQDKPILAPLLYYADSLKLEIHSGERREYLLGACRSNCPSPKTDGLTSAWRMHPRFFSRCPPISSWCMRPSDFKQTVRLPEVPLHIQSNDLWTNWEHRSHERAADAPCPRRHLFSTNSFDSSVSQWCKGLWDKQSQKVQFLFVMRID